MKMCFVYRIPIQCYEIAMHSQRKQKMIIEKCERHAQISNSVCYQVIYVHDNLFDYGLKAHRKNFHLDYTMNGPLLSLFESVDLFSGVAKNTDA